MNIINDITPYIPFFTPAVEKDRCAVDIDVSIKRIAVIAAIAFAAIAATFAVAVTFGLSSLIILPCLSLFGLVYLDYWLSVKGVNEKALKEYLELKHPSTSATEWMQKDESLIEQLIEKKGDVNKTDQSGHRFLDSCINPLNVEGEENSTSFKLFKNLVDHTDLRLQDTEGYTYMEKIFQSANSLYLETIKNKIPTGLTDTQKFNCWLHLGHSVKPETMEELKKKGLLYDMADKDGKTPVVRLIELDPELKSQHYSRGLSPEDHVIALLRNTDDLKQNVTFNGQSLTILEFLKTLKEREPIKKFLEHVKEVVKKQ